jgi:hypothetical protein
MSRHLVQIRFRFVLTWKGIFDQAFRFPMRRSILGGGLCKFPIYKMFLKSRRTLSAKRALQLADGAWTNYPGSLCVPGGAWNLLHSTVNGFFRARSDCVGNYFGADGGIKWRDGMTMVIVRSKCKESMAGRVEV